MLALDRSGILMVLWLSFAHVFNNTTDVSRLNQTPTILPLPNYGPATSLDFEVCQLNDAPLQLEQEELHRIEQESPQVESQEHVIISNNDAVMHAIHLEVNASSLPFCQLKAKQAKKQTKASTRSIVDGISSQQRQIIAYIMQYIMGMILIQIITRTLSSIQLISRLIFKRRPLPLTVAPTSPTVAIATTPTVTIATSPTVPIATTTSLISEATTEDDVPIVPETIHDVPIVPETIHDAEDAEVFTKQVGRSRSMSNVSTATAASRPLYQRQRAVLFLLQTMQDELTKPVLVPTSALPPRSPPIRAISHLDAENVDNTSTASEEEEPVSMPTSTATSEVDKELTTDISFVDALLTRLEDLHELQQEMTMELEMRLESLTHAVKFNRRLMKQLEQKHQQEQQQQQQQQQSIIEINNVDAVQKVLDQSSVVLVMDQLSPTSRAIILTFLETQKLVVHRAVLNSQHRYALVRLFHVADSQVKLALFAELAKTNEFVPDREQSVTRNLSQLTMLVYDSRFQSTNCAFIPTVIDEARLRSDETIRHAYLGVIGRSVRHAAASLTSLCSQAVHLDSSAGRHNNEPRRNSLMPRRFLMPIDDENTKGKETDEESEDATLALINVNHDSNGGGIGSYINKLTESVTASVTTMITRQLTSPSSPVSSLFLPSASSRAPLPSAVVSLATNDDMADAKQITMYDTPRLPKELRQSTSNRINSPSWLLKTDFASNQSSSATEEEEATHDTAVSSRVAHPLEEDNNRMSDTIRTRANTASFPGSLSTAASSARPRSSSFHVISTPHDAQEALGSPPHEAADLVNIPRREILWMNPSNNKPVPPEKRAKSLDIAASEGFAATIAANSSPVTPSRPLSSPTKASSSPMRSALTSFLQPNSQPSTPSLLSLTSSPNLTIAVNSRPPSVNLFDEDADPFTPKDEKPQSFDSAVESDAETNTPRPSSSSLFDDSATDFEDLMKKLKMTSSADLIPASNDDDDDDGVDDDNDAETNHPQDEVIASAIESDAVEATPTPTSEPANDAAIVQPLPKQRSVFGFLGFNGL